MCPSYIAYIYTIFPTNCEYLGDRFSISHSLSSVVTSSLHYSISHNMLKFTTEGVGSYKDGVRNIESLKDERDHEGSDTLSLDSEDNYDASDNVSQLVISTNFA